MLGISLSKNVYHVCTAVDSSRKRLCTTVFKIKKKKEKIFDRLLRRIFQEDACTGNDRGKRSDFD